MASYFVALTFFGTSSFVTSCFVTSSFNGYQITLIHFNENFLKEGVAFLKWFAKACGEKKIGNYWFILLIDAGELYSQFNLKNILTAKQKLNFFISILSKLKPLLLYHKKLPQIFNEN